MDSRPARHVEQGAPLARRRARAALDDAVNEARFGRVVLLRVDHVVELSQSRVHGPVLVHGRGEGAFEPCTADLSPPGNSIADCGLRIAELLVSYSSHGFSSAFSSFSRYRL